MQPQTKAGEAVTVMTNLVERAKLPSIVIIVTSLVVISMVYYMNIPATPNVFKWHDPVNQNIRHVIMPEQPYPTLLHLIPPSYLPSFRNPCWMEVVDGDKDPYEGNLFLVSKARPQVAKHIKNIQTSWQKLLKRGIRQTKRLRCLPYFYLIGVNNCGTSYLFRRITEHPHVADVAIKEPHWWGQYSFGFGSVWPIPLRDYVDVFDEAANIITQTANSSTKFHPVITGEGTPSTVSVHMKWPPSLQNTNISVAHLIRHFTPNARFILSLRDPVNRAYSTYGKIMSKKNKESSPEHFHTYVKKAIRAARSCFHYHSVRACVYDPSVQFKFPRFLENLYYVYVQDWLAAVPRHQIIISRLEDRISNPQQAYDDIFTFLGLEPIPNFEKKQKLHNAHRTRRAAMLDATNKMLADFFRPFNLKLAALLGDDKFAWSARKS